jgi:hypothetical protein
MREAEFREWLKGHGANTEEGRNTRVHAVKTIERKLSELGSPFTTLADAWANDRFEQLRERIRQMRQNAREGGADFRILMPESQKPLNRLSSWNSWLAGYGRLLAGDEPGEVKDADRIRQYVLEHYIEPARDEGRDSVEVLVSDVNRALDLNQAWPNICQALAGKMFQDLAEVPAPERIGADQSSATRFRFSLSGATWAETELRRRYGEPITETDKMIGFALRDGRHLALQRDVNGTQIWIEDPGPQSKPPIPSIRRYAAEQARHSNLPPRLRHRGSQGNQSRPVVLLTISSLDELRSTLDWYEGEQALNRSALEQLRRRFVSAFPDFRNFAEASSSFHRQEDDYKRALIGRAAELLADTPDESELGARLLDLLAGKGGLQSNLLGWRMSSGLSDRRKRHPGVLETAAGRLVHSDEVSEAIATFVQDNWPIFAEGQEGDLPFGDSRTIPTLIGALVRPADTIAIRYQPFFIAGQALLGRSLFANAPLTLSELREVEALAREIFRIMDDEWGWRPRDLWDVQGFIWVTCQKRLTQDELAARSLEPTGETPVQTTNLILFGPPGTGKTFATAEEALKLCGEEVPHDRGELMATYRRLVEAGRIEFVTFHQSYAYEEFVEGLRPIQQEDQSAGFHLEAEAGVLRRVARRAETSTGSGGPAFVIGDRQVFKMSIGEAANPDDAHLFEEAVEGGYTLLGFEDIDWSDERFANRQAIIEEVKARGVIEGGEPNAMSGRVQMPFIFRNWVKPGDIIVVSKGNSLFRAIGEVTGEYQFVPREGGDYGHRRAVRWLWVDRTGVPVSEIYSRNFTMKSIYLLARADLNVPALERYIASQQGGGGAPESFVLIIDEINRANVSKVMGELITLLEPDKRIGATNELRVRLPYSRDIFGLPANLHIVGTMNTADRSIALLDTALRRRFKFKEVPPEPELLEEAEQATGLPLVDFLSAINDRIEYLLDREHRIGHAYFINCRTREQVDAAMRNAVIPLLQEYFFEDLSRVAIVLGDPKGGGFLSSRQIKDPLGESDARDSWSVLPEFAEDAYNRSVKPDTPVHLVEPPAQAAE